MKDRLILIRKDVVFDGHDNNHYLLTKNVYMIIPKEVKADLVLDFIQCLLFERNAIKIATEAGPAPHDLLLFRLATIFDDVDFLMIQGTLSWMDDVVNMKDCSQEDLQISSVAYHALQHLVQLTDVIFDNLHNDALTNKLADLGYLLYRAIITEMILL